ncbi:hypothetical protein ACFOET_12215 [Parapedobacter deserti]|uniref:Magnesium citrate secondary transporter n=1 Tax=Parapedobacter deserti TaxID=1912957 RepID=A0ABV7JJU4_9SPHI
MVEAIARRSLEHANAKDYRQDPYSAPARGVLTRIAGGFSADISDCVMKQTTLQLTMRMLTKPWFVTLLVLAFAHQLTQKILAISLPLADNYLDALLFMPILLHLVLWERRAIFAQGGAHVLHPLHILIILALASVFAEHLLPRWSARFTADVWDMVCYAVGALLFIYYWNKPLKPLYPHDKTAAQRLDA